MKYDKAITVLRAVRYYRQPKQDSVEDYRNSYIATCAMAVKFLLPDALSNCSADREYLEICKKHGDSVYFDTHAKALREVNTIGIYTSEARQSDILSEIDFGSPVGLRVSQAGPCSAPSGGGHWILGIGHTPIHLIVHDPIGEVDMFEGGYKNLQRGKFMYYLWEELLVRWAVEGPGNGQMMKYRAIKP